MATAGGQNAPKTHTYYGVYSLKHWINLLLSGNIVLPEYQRSFAWDERKIGQFVESLLQGDYVPPVTIAAGQENGKPANLILDGQQRLTAILLAALGYIPKLSSELWESNLLAEEVSSDEGDEASSTSDEGDGASSTSDEGDGASSTSDEGDGASSTSDEGDEASSTSDEGDEASRTNELNPSRPFISWSFSLMLQEASNARDMTSLRDFLSNSSSRYDRVVFLQDINPDDFLNSVHLGFLYIVPNESAADSQQFFARLFRSINYDGVRLSKEESRRALYYQDRQVSYFFEGKLEDGKEILEGVRIMQGAVGHRKIDWLRYLSVLSQKKIGNLPLKNYSNEAYREDYYVDYVAYILGLPEIANPGKFGSFNTLDVYAQGLWRERYSTLSEAVRSFQVEMKDFPSWIDADYWLLGLIYHVVFEGKNLTLTEQKKEELKATVKEKISDAKSDALHKDRPNQLRFFRLRINESIELYRDYVS
nr:DUF262 domain-containing protein [uncultured Porphyromonas sp.]